MNRLKATLDSLKGAAGEVDKAKYPPPDESYLREHVNEADLAMVAPLVSNMLDITAKAASAMKKRKVEATRAAESMIVDGLADHIGFRLSRGMDMAQYLGVLFIWLLRAQVDFSQDPYTDQLLKA